MKIKLILLLLISSLFGCNSKNSNIIDLSNLKPNEGFIDVPLSVVSTAVSENYYEYDVKAIVNNDTIGIIIKLKKNIPAGFVNGEPKNMFLSDGIEFVSKGIESDKLLGFLSKNYGLNESNTTIKDSQLFTCANLNESKTNYKTGESRFKIFLEGEEDYAELFVNFNFSKSIISLNEKDEEYREPLIKLMKK